MTESTAHYQLLKDTYDAVDALRKEVNVRMTDHEDRLSKIEKVVGSATIKLSLIMGGISLIITAIISVVVSYLKDHFNL